MTDLPPMDACPRRPDGNHALMALYPNDLEQGNDLTLACQRCGAIRRIPLVGALYDAGTKDTLPADVIVTLVGDGPWETR